MARGRQLSNEAPTTTMQLYRVCLTCEIKKTCVTCKVPKPESDFGAAAWKARHVDRRICRACADRVRGCWTCSACGTRLPKEDFSAWQRRRAYAENGTQTCNYCFQSLAVFRCAQRTRERLRTLRKKLQRQKKEQILDQVRADICAIVGSRLSSNCQASVPRDSSHQMPQNIGEECLEEHQGRQTKEAKAEGNTTQTTRRKTNGHRRHRACNRRKKTETRRGQRRNTASRAESKATQRRNRRGPRTADRRAS